MSRRVWKFNFCAFHHIYVELLKYRIKNIPNDIRAIYDIIGYIDFNYVYSKQKQKCSMAKFEFIYVEIKIGMQHTYKQSHNVKENFC